MNSEDPKSSSDDEEAIGPMPQPLPVADGSETAPIKNEVSEVEDSLVDLPAAQSKATNGEPLELSEPTDPPLPEIVADAPSVRDIASDAAGRDSELPQDSPSPMAEESSVPATDLVSDLERAPEEDDRPLDVEIELPSAVPFARSGSTTAEMSTVDASPSQPADSAPPSEQSPIFTADAPPAAEIPAARDFPSEDFATPTLPLSGDEPSPPVFAERDSPQSQFANFDSQSAAEQPDEPSRFEPGVVQPMAPSESQADTESFRMPPLVLEVSHAEAEHFRQDFLDFFVPSLSTLMRDCIESAFNKRDFEQAARMRAVYR